MNDLYAEFEGIISDKLQKVTEKFFNPPAHPTLKNFSNSTHTHKKFFSKLQKFQDKLASLKFLDPACGSGNFLTETYLSLRRLENEVLKQVMGAEIKLGDLDNPIKVSINQFYGIEINDFAVSVAKTALWIAESQMMTETSEIVHKDLDFLPLKTSATIVEANALTMDWHTVAPQANYIMGNPPFVGKSYQTKTQKTEMANIFDGIKGYGNLDYVTCWYKKAADFIQNTHIKCAFVSTNSICQGIAVPPLWNYLFNNGVVINFAYRTFKWQSESTDMAQVHCIIVGFSMIDTPKIIFDGDKIIEAQNINAYLLDAPNIIVEPRNKPLFDVPPMYVGVMPCDNGNFILSEIERAELVKKYPAAEKFIHPYMGSEDFINDKQRFCLWLKDSSPAEIKKISPIYERVKNVRDFRLKSTSDANRKLAATPTLYARSNFIDAPKLLIPMLSSSSRNYIPIGFIDSKIVVSNLASFIPNGDIFLFGILTSRVLMTWLKTVGSRFKTDYRFSASIVYNTFPFCQPTDKQRKKIEQTAQSILDARNLYPDSSLADLYDERTMPPKLRRAHQLNDRAVMDAYGFDHSMTESEIVAELMKLYKKLTNI